MSGGERELRTTYLKPFNRACVESLSIMTAYSSYDGIPAIANTRAYRADFISRGMLTTWVQIYSLKSYVVLHCDEHYT